MRENQTPYYIGKGKGRRAFAKGRHRSRPIDPSNIVIIADNLTEDEAFALEIKKISEYGRKIDGGILNNISLGGEGVSGVTWDDERKAKRTVYLKEYYNSPAGEKTKQSITERQAGKSFAERFGEERSSIIGKKIADKQLGISLEERWGEDKAREAKEKIKAARSNQIFGPESNRKRSEAMKIAHATKTYVAAKVTCPHCGKTMDHRNAYRWHGDKCKSQTT